MNPVDLDALGKIARNTPFENDWAVIRAAIAELRELRSLRQRVALLEQSDAVLRQIAAHPRRTKEQRLANSWVRLSDELSSDDGKRVALVAVEGETT